MKENGKETDADPTAPVAHRLLVTGSRTIKDQKLVWTDLDRHYKNKQKPSLLVHGGAIGVDMLAGAWAKEHGIPVKVVPPDFKQWPVSKYHWKAYTERDYAMVDMVDRVVAIWDGQSGGTKKTFVYAELKGKLDHVFNHLLI